LRITDIIAKKRDGSALTDEEISFFVKAYTAGDSPDYQASALLMAIYLRGMNDAETAALTGAMAASGRQLDLHASGLPTDKPTLDKHSTGGVGDKTSLVVVPILASLGIYVCKMSGRGLGHTGGTLDKLESIPGFRVGLSPEEMVRQVANVGACLAGQTADLAPADKKLYALRDATATVGSLPLIVSSILSKKLAGGASSFLFDVKVGNGALMETLDEARALAKALVDGAQRHQRPAIAVLSDMSQPLGDTIGNALEVGEAIRTLTPHAAPINARFRELCIYLAAKGLLLAGTVPAESEARTQVEDALQSVAALAAFRRIVQAQGGDVSVVDDPTRLPAAPIVEAVTSPQAGYVAGINARLLGEAVVALGGGRARKEDTIDPAVGMVVATSIGKPVEIGGTLVYLHARNREQLTAARTAVLSAYQFSPQPVSVPPLIRDVLASA
jgi:pyrimidine-nucleoside phosphorylase